MTRFLLFFLLIGKVAFLDAGVVRVGKSWSDSKYAPTHSVQEHFDLGCQAVEKRDWEEGLTQFMVILHHYQQTPFLAESLYQTAVCYYFLGDFDLADRRFGEYLNLGGNLKYFEKVFEFKYHIAEYYRQGRKKHLFGLERFPRLASGKGDAAALYDEVIASLPSREIATQALYSKALLLFKKKEYKESIETLQTLIRRFPKHHLAAESYLTIGEIYLQEGRREAQNPDLIGLAQINAQRFKKSFPGDERGEKIDQSVLAMQEIYAESLYDTGYFFEKLKKPEASAIYYQDTINRYPETQSAQKSRQRLDKIAVGRS